MNSVRKYPLGFFPTPLQELKRFSARYRGCRLFIKRDDHTGLATGGNKTRKLEYLLGDALARGADTVITAGAQQSNHCRQTAAGCAMAGLSCHLLLGGEKPPRLDGNLLLSHILGANIHYAGENRKGEDMETLMEELRSQGRRPYAIPYGGSNLTGAMGFAEAAGELGQQLSEQELYIDYIFFASSSGGMQAGLTLGSALHGLGATLMPISIDKEESGGDRLEELIYRLVCEGDRKLRLGLRLTAADIPLIRGYDKYGYGKLTQQEKEAILALARTEGILLDPVYTGRAFYGMMDHLERELLPPGAHVLFWHTGGIPATFSYAAAFAENG